MATQWNRAGHYIFALWFLSSFFLSFYHVTQLCYRDLGSCNSVGANANLKGPCFQQSLSVCLWPVLLPFTVDQFWWNLVTRTLLWSSLAATIMVQTPDRPQRDHATPFWKFQKIVKNHTIRSLRRPSKFLSGFASWQCYCTALYEWASAKHCGVEQRMPPVFGRAAITLGIGPHSSFFCLWIKYVREPLNGFAPNSLKVKVTRCDQDQKNALCTPIIPRQRWNGPFCYMMHCSILAANNVMQQQMQPFCRCRGGDFGGLCVVYVW